MPPASKARRCVLVVLGLTLACSTYQPFDSTAHLRGLFTQGVGAEEAATIVIPFELTPEIRTVVTESIRPESDKKRRAEQVLDFIFDNLGLVYRRHQTLNAAETFARREGNCISFVSLFVGIARELRLDPFYVEVTDHQRWRHRAGMVVSNGHIVAGMYVEGELSTFDFSPRRAKSYRDFRPIDDRVATAHYYNNLGAEELLDGNIDFACSLLETTVRIAPEFKQGISNLGVCLAQRGDLDGALSVLWGGLELYPDNVPLLTNVAHIYQHTGQLDEAAALLDSIDTANNSNVFFYLYRGELALSQGELDTALEYMKEALRRDSDLSDVHLGLAKIHLEMGDLTSAQHFLGHALKLDATNEEALEYARLIRDRSN